MGTSHMITPEFAGRRCIVVASAPYCLLPEARENDIVLGANGGAAIAHLSGRSVYGLVTTSHLFRNDRSRQEEATVKSLRGLSVDTVWIDVKNGPAPVNVLGKLGVDYRSIIDVTPEERALIVENVMGSRSWVSTGVWAICLAVASGAAELVVAGVSLSPGHCGQPWDCDRRMHVEEDVYCLRALLSHGVKTTSRSLALETGLELAK